MFDELFTWISFPLEIQFPSVSLDQPSVQRHLCRPSPFPFPSSLQPSRTAGRSRLSRPSHRHGLTRRPRLTQAQPAPGFVRAASGTGLPALTRAPEGPWSGHLLPPLPPAVSGLTGEGGGVQAAGGPEEGSWLG